MKPDKPIKQEKEITKDLPGIIEQHRIELAWAKRNVEWNRRMRLLNDPHFPEIEKFNL